MCSKHYNYSRQNLPIERFYRGKSEATRRGLAWNLSIKSYTKLLAQGCFYCDKVLSYETGSGLDRIDNTKGYALKNVVPCCGQCNQSRNDFYTVDEFKVMIYALKSYRNG